MNPFDELQGAVLAAIAASQAAGELPEGLATDRVTVEPPRDPSHGDAATNAALVLAKPAGRPPLAIAEALAARLLDLPQVETVEIAKPGFVNLRLSEDFWRAQVRVALQAGAGYGAADLGRGRVVNVEYCSANPTGPLHVGHGRGTAFVMCSQICSPRWAGRWCVSSMSTMAARRSTWWRALSTTAISARWARRRPSRPGFLPRRLPVASPGRSSSRTGARWRDAPECAAAAFREHAVAAMLALTKRDLAALGVEHDVFISEAALIADRPNRAGARAVGRARPD